MRSAAASSSRRSTAIGVLAGDLAGVIRNILRCAAERLSPTSNTPAFTAAIDADERHDQVHVARQCAQKVRAAYAHPDLGEAASSPSR